MQTTVELPFGGDTAGPIERHYLSPNAQSTSSFEFETAGLTSLPSFWSKNTFEMLTSAVAEMRASRKRHDFEMEMFGSSRRMSVLGGRLILDAAPAIASLYRNAGLTNFIQKIATAPIFPCEAEYEWCVVNFFEFENDTQGWHTDDTAYVLITMIEENVSASGEGGALEWISFDNHGSTTMPSSALPPDVATTRRLFMKAGDACLMRGNHVLHRISPIRAKDQYRVTLLLSWQHRLHVPRDGSGIALYT